MSVQESQSVRRRFTKFEGSSIFCFYSIFALECFCVATADITCLSLDEVSVTLQMVFLGFLILIWE